ncbi:ribonuclease H-like domain-containing protein [Dokdonella sp.]|uniref:ribonuclease H-like domain-containing protein n=1 Tax=Dokdonella sp. TaxID=2291710 RepID=UPI003C6F7541
MSTVAERLRQLRKDALILQECSVSLAIIPAQAGLHRDDEQKRKKSDQLQALRNLIRNRERLPQSLQPRRTLTPPAGEEIAPGLYYVETVLKYEAAETLEWPAIDDAPIDRRRLLCFDTETTGLAGGVGTRAFMIGVAAWLEGELTVRQLYLTTIAGERAMLQTFAGWLNPETILVSYNGKSYDAPLLKGRLRLNRVDHCLAALPHIDWLHPTRRVYKGHLPNCKLATIEREVLRIIREDDLPGSEAPAAWLAYLRGQSSRNLARVLDHNKQDVITLMRLGDHLTTR